MRTTTTVHWNKGNVSELHNQRDEQLCMNESHIDLQNEHGSSYHETWYHSDLRDKYLEIFGDAIEEYNAKQKRKDRMIDIDSYMKSVADDTRGKKQTKKVNGKKVVDDDAMRQGKQLSYEITVKVGNTYREKDKNGRTVYDAENHHIRHEELPRDLQRTILKRYCDTFQNENPAFRVVNINYHADEGFYNRNGVWEYSEAHPHIEFIPVASGFKQGLSVQNSMNKAMKSMGFDDSDCYDKWAKKEQERLEKITQEEYEKYCNDNPDFHKEHGDLEVYHPVTEKSLQGNKSKEQLAQEQELDEAIHEAEYVKRVFTNGCKKNKERENALQAQEDALNEKQAELQAELLKAQNERNTALQMQTSLREEFVKKEEKLHDEFQHKEDALDAQRIALEEAVAIYEKATAYNQHDAQPTPFTEWAKQKEYTVPVITVKQEMKPDMSGYDFKKTYARDENGKIKMRKTTPYADYQQEMKRKQSYQFSDDEQNTIRKARGFEFDF